MEMLHRWVGLVVGNLLVYLVAPTKVDSKFNVVAVSTIVKLLFV